MSVGEDFEEKTGEQYIKPKNSRSSDKTGDQATLSCFLVHAI